MPGRRLKADISKNYLVEYKELLKQNGVDIKALKASKAAAAAAKTGKAPEGLPKFPGLPRAGASPGAGGRAMLGSVVERLERTYAATHDSDDDEDEDEDEEGDSEKDEAEESEADASGESASDSDGSDDEAGGPSSGEQGEPGPDSGSSGGASGAAVKGATGSAEAGAGAQGGPATARAAGAASDGAGAGAKKPRQRRRPFEAYEVDFIDDDEEIRYEKSRRVKVKYQGFFINQGPVELERDPEAEEDQPRQAPRRAPRPRPPPGAQPGKAKAQAAPAEKPQAGSAATLDGAAGVAAAAAAPGTSGAAPAPMDAGATTPVRGGGGGGKRRAEGEQLQPLGKKRKQPQQEAVGAAPRSPIPAAAARMAADAAAPPPGPRVEAAAAAAAPPAAAQGLAALAASRGRSAGATAAGLGAAGAAPTHPLPPTAAAAAVPHAPPASAAAPAAASERPAGGSAPVAVEPAPEVGAPASPAAGVGASQPHRVAWRRQLARPATLETLINDCRKKLLAAPAPPGDWAALTKLLEAQLTQVALYLNRNHRHDAQTRDAGLARVAELLLEAAPSVAGGSAGAAGPLSELRDYMQRRVDKAGKDLVKLLAGLKKVADEAVAAGAGAPTGPADDGGGGEHSSDDESADPLGPDRSSTAAALLEALDGKLRSCMNLYCKVHSAEDEGAALQAVADQAGVSIDLLQRAQLAAQNRPVGQRKRLGSKPTAAAAVILDDEDLPRRAAALAEEARSLHSEGDGSVPAAAGGTRTAPALPVTAAGPAPVPAAFPGPDAAFGQAGQPAPAPMATRLVLNSTAIAAHGSAAGIAAADGRGNAAAAPAAGAEAATDGLAVAAAAAAAAGGPLLDVHQQFPGPEEDLQQRRQCRAALKSWPAAKEELLDRALDAATSSEWATLAVKVLCHSPDGMSVPELAKRALELRYISWPSHKPVADMHRQLRQALNRVSLASHVLHVGANKYLLQAIRPDARAVPRPPPARAAGGGGGSANSSPAAAGPPVVPVAVTTAAGGAFGAGGGAPVPFPLLASLSAQPAEPPESEQVAAGAARQPTAAPAPAAPAAAAAQQQLGSSAIDVDAAPGAPAGGGGGGGEEELTAEEDLQQCKECVEVAVQAGADRQRVVEALSKLRPRNPRMLFKVLCHAGPTGMRVADIVKFARDHHFVNWPGSVDRSSSVHGAIRYFKEQVAHVGMHQYALALFPGVVHVPKPESRRGAGGGRGGGAGGAAGAGDEAAVAGDV